MKNDIIELRTELFQVQAQVNLTLRMMTMILENLDNKEILEKIKPVLAESRDLSLEFRDELRDKLEKTHDSKKKDDHN